MGWFTDFIDDVGSAAKDLGKWLLDKAEAALAATLGQIIIYGYWGFLEMMNATKSRTRLSDCLAATLAGYFTTITMSSVRIVTNANGILWGSAVTEGYTIFWKGNFDESNDDDIWLLVHELSHVVQYKELGRAAFNFLYTWEAIKAGNHDGNAYEIAADQYRGQIWLNVKTDLQNNCRNTSSTGAAVATVTDDIEWFWLLH